MNFWTNAIELFQAQGAPVMPQQWWADHAASLNDKLARHVAQTYVVGAYAYAQGFAPSSYYTTRANAIQFTKDYLIYGQNISWQENRYSMSVIHQTQKALDAALVRKTSGDLVRTKAEQAAELKKTLQSVFGKDRAELIAATEVSRIVSIGQVDAWKQHNESAAAKNGNDITAVMWFATAGEKACPICGSLNNSLTLFSSSKGPLPWEFSQALLDAQPAIGKAMKAPQGIKHPPAHPRCKCVLKPVTANEFWDFNGPQIMWDSAVSNTLIMKGKAAQAQAQDAAVMKGLKEQAAKAAKGAIKTAAEKDKIQKSIGQAAKDAAAKAADAVRQKVADTISVMGNAITKQRTADVRQWFDRGETVQYNQYYRRKNQYVKEFFDDDVVTAKIHIQRKLSEMTNVPQEAMRLFIRQWAETSNDTDYRSMSIQAAAARVFGVDLTPWQKGRIEKLEADREEAIARSGRAGILPATQKDLLMPFEDWSEPEATTSEIEKATGEKKPEAVIERVLKAMYDNTQQEFKKLGYAPTDTITLYRGVELDEPADYVKTLYGTVVKMRANALESWSMYKPIADSFSGTNPDKAVVYRADIPIADLVGSARTGFGCLDEWEFVAKANPNQVAYVMRRGEIDTGAAFLMYEDDEYDNASD